MKIIIVLVASVVLMQTCHALTKAQLKNTARVMRNVCQPRNNVSNELIDNISKGEFIDDKNVKCYIACVLQMAQTMKNGKLNYEAGLRQIDILFPEDMRESAKKSLQECRNVPDKYKDICEASFQTAKCMYTSNPSNFVFP